MPIDLDRVRSHAREAFAWAKEQQPSSGPHGAALGRLQAMASICEGVAQAAVALAEMIESAEQRIRDGLLTGDFESLKQQLQAAKQAVIFTGTRPASGSPA